ncbi:zinc ion binding [Trapelia coarctata]|nr:zinc ion binding [Trapelia coarctata]
MSAYTHTLRGLPTSTLSLNLSHPVPSLRNPTSALIRITHCAFNPGPSILMTLIPPLFRHTPSIPELDFAGTTISLGSSVPASRALAPGTPVFGSIPVGFHLKTGAGALAEYVAVESECVVKTPEGKRGEDVAGLAVAGCTALLLAEKAGLKRGASVLVNGASGGIGHMVLQMVREAVGESGRVVAVCSERSGNGEMIRGLGADEVIDYTAHSPVSAYLAKRFSATPFSAIIDAYGIQDIFTHCESYLAEGKPFVTVGVAIKDYSITGVLSAGFQMMSNSLWPRMLGGVNRDYVQVSAIANLEAMTKLAGLVEGGKLRVVRDGEWGMGDALKAYERLLSRRANGKIVVKVQDES